MKADGLEDLSFPQIQDLLDACRSQFQQEQGRINKNIAKYQNFQKLMETYHKYVQPYEGVVPYMYLDSQGYPTIGCGHLIGFNWLKKHHHFWQNSEVKGLLHKLTQQIKVKNLSVDPNFQHLGYPEDISQFLELSRDDYLALYRVGCVCYGFLDVQKMGKEEAFDQVNDTHLRLRIKEDNAPDKHNPQKSSMDKVRQRLSSARKNSVKDIDEALFKAYTLLMGFSLKLKTRQDFLKKSANNPFGGSGFYNFNNFNAEPSTTHGLQNSSSSGRFDYSHNYQESSSDFKPESLKEFNGTFSKDLVVIHYHGEGEDQTYKWFTPALWANQMQTLEEVLDRLALLKAFGDKTHVIVAKIPRGEKVRFLHGKAAPQSDSKTRESLHGGHEQYRFHSFDPKWIWGKRKIPVGHGYNNLVMKVDKIEELAERDIFLKIAELDARFNFQLKLFPFSAQLALLDLAFNMGAGGISKHVVEAALGGHWDLLASNPGWYHRENAEIRNKQIQKWFVEAAQSPSFNRL